MADFAIPEAFVPQNLHILSRRDNPLVGEKEEIKDYVGESVNWIKHLFNDALSQDTHKPMKNSPLNSPKPQAPFPETRRLLDPVLQWDMQWNQGKLSLAILKAVQKSSITTQKLEFYNIIFVCFLCW